MIEKTWAMVTCDLCILFTLLIVVPNSSSEDEVKLKPPINPDKFKVHFMEANSTYNFKPSKRGFFERHLNTYCYSGAPKALGRLLESIELHLEIEGDDYTQYDGTTPQEVEEHYNEHRSLFSFSLFSQKRSQLPLSPFVQQCIGIDTIQPYSVRLLQEKMDYIRLGMLLCGIVIFLFAGHLSTNSIFYYITGILFGICSSFILLIWLAGKLMPQRTMMYGVVIGGWAVGFYVIRMLWTNLQLIMVTYRVYVCWYIIVTGMISFLFCYRWGPPKNRRSKNIIKWLLQLISLTFIYISSNFKEAITAIIAMTVILYYFPRVLKNIMHFKGKRSKYVSRKKKNVDAGMMTGELRYVCKQWRFNSPQHIDGEVNMSSPCLSINTKSSIMDDNNFSHESNYVDKNLSDTDNSANENNVSKEKLYLLPDGSFILSEKPPKIFIPRHIQVAPIYHRSTPAMTSAENYVAGDHTHKLHQGLPSFLSNTRDLTSASSTSELCVKKGRRSIQPQSQFHRSSSVQRSEIAISTFGNIGQNEFPH